MHGTLKRKTGGRAMEAGADSPKRSVRKKRRSVKGLRYTAVG
jgi:hypothetical protein